MAYVIVVFLLVGVVWLISGPLRRGAAAGPAAEREQYGESMQRIDLEAARDAKYREIRDAELDHQTGKLSDEDYEAIDSTLRSEAIALLHELDALDEAGAQHDGLDDGDGAESGDGVDSDDKTDRHRDAWGLGG